MIKNQTFEVAGGALRLIVGENDVRVELTHPATGKIIGTPLLALEIRDRMQERTETFGKYMVVAVETSERGAHVVVREAFREVTIGIWLELRDDNTLSALTTPVELEEQNEGLYRLYALNLLPELMTCQGADSNILLPLASGVLCCPADKPERQDRFLIYGEQIRWELLPTLPVCAVQSAEGGVVALGAQGAQDMYCRIATDGKGSGSTGFTVMFREQWIDVVEWCEREVRYTFPAAQEDIVLCAARTVNAFVKKEWGKKTLKERAAESPVCAYQQKAYTMKIFHGIQRQGIMMYGQTTAPDALLFQTTLTFDAAAEGLRKLKAAGIDRVYVQSVGWNCRGHDGAWPTDFPIDRRLGGEERFRSLIAEAKNLGYHFTPHINYSMCCFNSPDYKPEYVIHDVWGEPKVTGFWGGGVHGNNWGLALSGEWIEERLHKLQELGCNGMQYIDFQGNPLYANYHPQNKGPRGDYAAGIRRYQKAAMKVTGGVAVECGFLYCAQPLDASCAPYYAPGMKVGLREQNWALSALLDTHVPLWQLALHDLVTQESQGAGWGSVMNGILFGRVMRDEWAGKPGVMPVLNDRRIEILKAIYDLVTVRFGHLVTEAITDWKRIAPGVEQTRFADGTEVLADFNQQELTVNGEKIERPEALRG